MARRIDEAIHNQRQHVERRPADLNVTRRVGIPHFDRVVDQHQLDFEVFSVRRLPNLFRLESVVRMNDRSPTGPDVECEANRVVGERLIGRDPLHRRELLRRLESVFLQRRDARIVMRLDGTGLQIVSAPAELFRIDDLVGLVLISLRREEIRPKHREPD